MDVEEVVHGLALVRRPLVVRLGDLVAHPVAQVGGPAGGGQAVVEPPAVVGPVLRLLELHPELPLVPVAIPIHDRSGRLTADGVIGQEVGDAFVQHHRQQRSAARVGLLIVDQLVHDDARDYLGPKGHGPRPAGQLVSRRGRVARDHLGTDIEPAIRRRAHGGEAPDEKIDVGEGGSGVECLEAAQPVANDRRLLMDPKRVRADRRVVTGQLAQRADQRVWATDPQADELGQARARGLEVFLCEGADAVVVCRMPREPIVGAPEVVDVARDDPHGVGVRAAPLRGAAGSEGQEQPQRKSGPHAEFYPTWVAQVSVAPGGLGR